MLSFFKNIIRLVYLGSVLLYYRAFAPLYFFPLIGPVVRLFPCKLQNQGVRLAKAFELMGPTFIKLGQTLSTRPDLVGDEVAAGLARLQDRLPPFKFAEVRAQIELQLGQEIEYLFREFAEVPIAAASISQVHKAVTTEGKVVAVKVLRPRIEQRMAKDISLFLWLAGLLERFVPSTRRLRPVATIGWFAGIVKMELDLRFEAAAASEMRDNCLADGGIYIPIIDWGRSAKRVMTMEWVEGISIYDKPALLAAGHDLVKLSANLAVSFFNQAYRDGLFHADLHPGNLFVLADGRLAMVDFGIVGRMDENTRLYMAEILRGFLTRDYAYVARIHFDAGYVPRSKDIGAFAQAIRSIGEPIVGQPVNKISVGKLLAQLFKITEDFAMETQPQLLLLQKTTVLVEGIGQSLNPEVNLWKLAEPWIDEWVIDNIGPEAKLKRGLTRLVNSFSRWAQYEDAPPPPTTAPIYAHPKTSNTAYVVLGISLGVNLCLVGFVLLFLA